jgi:uncharacterized protein (UPF0264 family)
MALSEKHIAALPKAIRAERLRAMIQIATTLLAVRAVAIEDGDKLSLAEPDFIANLIEMCTSALQAPWVGPA